MPCVFAIGTVTSTGTASGEDKIGRGLIVIDIGIVTSTGIVIFVVLA